jgi:hypothetical protein
MLAFYSLKEQIKAYESIGKQYRSKIKAYRKRIKSN